MSMQVVIQPKTSIKMVTKYWLHSSNPGRDLIIPIIFKFILLLINYFYFHCLEILVIKYKLFIS